jgi:hypothetical protein
MDGRRFSFHFFSKFARKGEKGSIFGAFFRLNSEIRMLPVPLIFLNAIRKGKKNYSNSRGATIQK